MNYWNMFNSSKKKHKRQNKIINIYQNTLVIILTISTSRTTFIKLKNIQFQHYQMYKSQFRIKREVPYDVIEFK